MPRHLHYRRVTKDEKAELLGELLMTDYVFYASYNAVVVGEMSNGDQLIHVNAPDTEDLPGEYLGYNISDCPKPVQDQILDAEWEEEIETDEVEKEIPAKLDEETGDVITPARKVYKKVKERKRGKVSGVPKGVTPSATDIVPHRFA